MKLRAVIIDDEPIARLRIRRLLQPDPDCEVIGEYGDGESAVAGICAERPDLVFLDVQMAEMDGFEVTKRVGLERMPVTIFVTAHDHYALRAFDAHALDYLLKPFGKARFEEALGRAKQHIAGGVNRQALRSVVAMLGPPASRSRYPDQLPVNEHGHVVFVCTADIDWIEAAGNYARLHVGSRQFEVRETLTTIGSKLDPLKYVRIHRSTIVNVSSIKEIHPWFGGHHLVVLNNGTELRMSRYPRDVARQLGVG
jgi:two-component system LytT family response regulator